MYGVYKGFNPGVYYTWEDCKKEVIGFSGAKFKKFDDIISAKKFVKYGTVEKSNEFLKSNDEFINIDEINVYTDGGCYGNGKELCYGGYGIFFSENNPKNMFSSVNGKCTNNICELKAILDVLIILKKDIDLGTKICIWTDSEYCIKAFTSSGDKYHRNLWKPKPANIELIKPAYYILKSKRDQIRFKHINSHTGKKDIHSISNDFADKLATMGLKKSIAKADNLGLNKFKNGKYKGLSLEYIKNIDLSYLTWYLTNKPYKREEIFLYIIENYLNKK